MNDKRNENVLVKYLVWLEDEIFIWSQIERYQSSNYHDIHGMVLGLELARQQLLNMERHKND